MRMVDRPSARTTHCAMGTVMAHKAFGPRSEESLEAVRAEVARIEGALSCFRPNSDIGRVNDAAGVRGETVSRETYDVLKEGLELSQSFPGCFDVTIAPLVTLWNRARESRETPDESSVRRAVSLVDYRDLILKPGNVSAGLRQVGQSLDLGGIGKGFAGDRIREVFMAFGIASAYSNLGGNVVAVGMRPDGSPWQIGIQHPRKEKRLIGTVSAVDETVVTSGDYQRCFISRQGKRHHHILDPMTGYPADTGLTSVTVVAKRSLQADPLSTILFIAGMERGLSFLTSFPGVEVIFVGYDLRVYVTAGLRHRFLAADGVDVTVLD